LINTDLSKRYHIQSQFLKVQLSCLGARICSIEHIPSNIEVHEYYAEDGLFHNKRKFTGAIVGPVANRISNSTFRLDNKDFVFSPNEGKALLHSGSNGLHKQDWDLDSHTQSSITFSLKRNYDDDGFPGKRKFLVKYHALSNTLKVEFNVLSSEDCPINLTTHGYFNLDGTHSLDHHEFQINASHYLPLNEEKLPTGEIHSVQNTPFDLRKKQKLNQVYDHHFIKDNCSINSIIAIAKSTLSGLIMEMKCSHDGLQFYTGNGRYFCFEPQSNPDSLANAHFPSIILNAGKEYKEFVSYTFTK